MSEKRSVPRMRRLKEGRIIFNGKKSLMSVKVRDASPTGARLICGEAYLAPQQFQVTIPGETDARPAERVWVKGSEMGVRFLD